MLKKYLLSFNLLKAFRDFPLSSAFALVTTMATILLVDHQDHNLLIKVAGAGYLSFLAAISCEVQKKISGKMWILIVPILVFVAWFFYLPDNFDDIPNYLEKVYIYRYVGMALILHLIISFIPYLRKSAEEDFWEYNNHLFLRIFESVLFSIITFVGLSVALLAIDKLFGFNVDSKWYARMYIFLMGIFNSIYFLSKYPEIDYNEDTQKPSSAYKVFSQYILIGISSIYLVLLYAYATKIIIEGSLPKGWIGYLTLCFSTVGILTWLLNYFNPKFSENRFTKFFVLHFFKFLTIPIIMLFIAIIIRLREYGITEHRYFVATLAVWLAILSIGYGWIKGFHIKFIPISLAILSMVAVFSGPTDMFSVSLKNQQNRLHRFIIENNLLNNSKFDISAIDKMDDNHKFSLKKSIIALGERSDLQIIDDWVEESLFENYNDTIDYNRAVFLNKKLGVINSLANKQPEDNYFNINAKGRLKIDVSGYKTMSQVQIVSNEFENDKFILVENGHEIQIPGFQKHSLVEMVLNINNNMNYEVPQPQMTVIFNNKLDSAKLVIEFLHGKVAGKKVMVEGGQGWLLETEKNENGENITKKVR